MTDLTTCRYRVCLAAAALLLLSGAAVASAATLSPTAATPGLSESEPVVMDGVAWTAWSHAAAAAMVADLGPAVAAAGTAGALLDGPSWVTWSGAAAQAIANQLAPAVHQEWPHQPERSAPARARVERRARAGLSRWLRLAR